MTLHSNGFFINLPPAFYFRAWVPERGESLKLDRNFLKVRSIRTKLIVYFLSLILLPMVTLGIIGSLIYSSKIEAQTTKHTTDMISQVNKNVEFYINGMEKTIGVLSKEPAIFDFLRLDSLHESSRVDCESEVRRILRSFKDTHPEIAGILVVSKNDIYISNEIYRITRDPLTVDKWYKLAVENPNAVQLLSKPIGRNLSTSLNYTADDVVSIAKAVKDPATGEILGVILIDMTLNTIKKIISDITLGISGFIYIMDSNGDVVYAPVNPIVYRVKDKWLSDLSAGSIEKKIKEGSYRIIFSKSHYTQWRTVGVFSLDEALKEVMSIRYYSMLIGIITLVMAVIASLFFTSSMVKPVKRLQRLMKIAEGGDFNVRFESSGNDEISQLGNSFNTMLGEIKKLVNMVYIEQKSKREAELKILQAQIKPHFLYNTLDTIQWMAQAHKANDIVEIIGALTNLFRIGLSKGKEMLSVAEELEHVKSYMVIQKARYEEKVDYDICYDDSITGCKVLKLILQPLVENAIYHGIKAKRGQGKISVNAQKKDGKLCFTIYDNGAGIDPERLAEINGMLDGSSPVQGNPGYGIFNVNERIRLSFGPEYGLKFFSTPGEGTTVEVWHPMIER